MLRTRWFWIVVAIGVGAAAGAVFGYGYWSENSPRAQAQAQQEVLRDIRRTLDRCLDELDRAQDRFWDHERRTRALRSQVDSYESLDPDGVPADRYDAYLETLESYNEAIPVWEKLGDSIRLQEDRCHDLADRHEEEREALRRFLVTEGLWNGL